MSIIKITPAELVEKLQMVVNQPIIKAIHPASALIFITIGQKEQFTIDLCGYWQLWQNDQLVIESKLSSTEDKITHFRRLEGFAENFPLKTIEAIKLVDNQVIFSSGSYLLKIALIEKELSGLNFSYQDAQYVYYYDYLDGYGLNERRTQKK